MGLLKQNHYKNKSYEKLCVSLMSDIEFKTTMTLDEYESYSLYKNLSHKTLCNAFLYRCV